MSLGELVKARRVELGLTQVQLAEKGGITQSLISELERGRRRYVTAADVRGLARALDLPEAEVWAAIPRERNGTRYIPLRSPTAGHAG